VSSTCDRGLTSRVILEGEEAVAPRERISYADFSARAAAAVTAAGGDVDAWGEQAGWDVAPLLEDPEQVWKLDVEGLQEIAEAAGVDWRSVLPD
jgi:hypothetical protein